MKEMLRFILSVKIYQQSMVQIEAKNWPKGSKLTSVLVLGWLWLGLALDTCEAGLGFISFCSCAIFSVNSFRVFMMLALSSGFIPLFFSKRFIKAWKKKDKHEKKGDEKKKKIKEGYARIYLLTLNLCL